ncbi:Sec63 Brl domain-containing protein [Glomus cerebriforme]|uniref:Sec63 Brl domain-containing protein n=1 Tax=Glomus cerebriforme TaxID=658196 RepID=A0A397T299_9GLOM|nr:Sec63 Brl domain-containing protein [Glomus cerebriforme]
MRYIYDEQGVTFNYFLLTFIAIFLIPTTYFLLFNTSKDAKLRKNSCNCVACLRKESYLKNRKINPTDRISKKAIFVAVGWIFLAYLAYQIATVKFEIDVWDPYEVLGIPENAPLSQIKKHFKELSRKWHPDKAPEDKKAEYESKFIDFTKAYKVLTDDDIRKNYEEWGHPDGKQAYSLGIALPTWLVEAKNSPFVLGVYALAFGIGLPFFVGRWWYSSNAYTKDGIRTHTMDLYFKELRNNSTLKQILDLLSASAEYKELVEQRPSDTTLLPQIVSSVKEELDKRFSEKYQQSKRVSYTAPYCQKASALLHSHLLRIHFSDEELLKDKYFIAERSIRLINGILDIALAHRWLQTSLRCMELSQHLVQAILNLKERIFYKKFNFIHILYFHYLRNVFKALVPTEYESIMQIAGIYPLLKIDRAYFKVAGDAIITPGSIVTLIIKLRVVNSTSKAKEVKMNGFSKENEKNGIFDDDDDEKGGYLDSEDELLFGRSKNKQESDEKNDYVHAPYLLKDKMPYWWIFMADDKKDRIIIEPTKITNIVTTRTIRCQFQAPHDPGLYSFVAYIKSDSYVGTDIRKDLRLDVKDFSELPPDEEIDDEISEPEEDSIAGQMKLMREQGFAAAVAGGGDQKKKNDDSDSSDSD